MQGGGWGRSRLRAAKKLLQLRHPLIEVIQLWRRQLRPRAEGRYQRLCLDGCLQLWGVLDERYQQCIAQHCVGGHLADQRIGSFLVHGRPFRG